MAGNSGPTFAEEERLRRQGYRLIAGIDEVGRGPLAGPVYAAAVILDCQAQLPFYGRLRDSKLLTPRQRERLAQEIRGSAVAVGVGSASPGEVDERGIVRATKQAMVRAVTSLPLVPDHLLLDALPLLESGLPFRAIIKGDALCRSIAAASIVAKVERDAYMSALEAEYPGYGFAKHKGYATAYHLAQLAHLGPCPAHRRSFAPIRSAGEAPTPPTLQRSRGVRGEEAALRFLRQRGYALVGRNYRCPWGEVDIIAEKGGCLAFVEVKARRGSKMGAPVEAVTPRKQQRLVMTAQHYLQAKGLAERPWQIDVVAIQLGVKGAVDFIEHLENVVGEF